MRRLWRPALDRLTPYEAGPSLEALRAQLGLAGVTRLSANENPLDPPPGVRALLDRRRPGGRHARGEPARGLPDRPRGHGAPRDPADESRDPLLSPQPRRHDHPRGGVPALRRTPRKRSAAPRPGRGPPRLRCRPGARGRNPAAGP